MIDIEQGALSAFEEEFPIVFDGIEEVGGGIGYEGLEFFGVVGVLIDDLLGIERVGFFGVIASSEERLFDGCDVSDALGEVVAVEVTESDGVASSDFVSVAGPDASQGGTDILIAFGGLIEGTIFSEVPGHDDVGSVADHHVIDGDPTIEEGLNFVEHGGGVEDDATGDDIGDVRVEDAAGDVMEFVGLVTDDDGVTSVSASLVADDNFLVGCEQIDQLTFGFVAPLEADDT